MGPYLIRFLRGQSDTVNEQQNVQHMANVQGMIVFVVTVFKAQTNHLYWPCSSSWTLFQKQWKPLKSFISSLIGFLGFKKMAYLVPAIRNLKGKFYSRIYY